MMCLKAHMGVIELIKVKYNLKEATPDLSVEGTIDNHLYVSAIVILYVASNPIKMRL